MDVKSSTKHRDEAKCKLQIMTRSRVCSAIETFRGETQTRNQTLMDSRRSADSGCGLTPLADDDATIISIIIIITIAHATFALFSIIGIVRKFVKLGKLRRISSSEEETT